MPKTKSLSHTRRNSKQLQKSIEMENFNSDTGRDRLIRTRLIRSTT